MCEGYERKQLKWRSLSEDSQAEIQYKTRIDGYSGLGSHWKVHVLGPWRQSCPNAIKMDLERQGQRLSTCLLDVPPKEAIVGAAFDIV